MVLVAFRQVLREAEVSHLRCAQREFQVARCFTRPRSAPLLKHFDIDPIQWGTLVFVNLQAAFLSPPVAMSAFYLKGVSPPTSRPTRYSPA